jgi:hypothetical protein
MDLNSIARQRISSEEQTRIDEQLGVVPVVKNNETKLERRRRLNNEANRRYRQTAKGKKTNALKCKKYFQSHRKQCQQYVINYKNEFHAQYGVWFTAWNYWRKKLVEGKCTEADIPPQYGKILADWKLKQAPDNIILLSTDTQ